MMGSLNNLTARNARILYHTFLGEVLKIYGWFSQINAENADGISPCSISVTKKLYGRERQEGARFAKKFFRTIDQAGADSAGRRRDEHNKGWKRKHGADSPVPSGAQAWCQS